MNERSKKYLLRFFCVLFSTISIVLFWENTLVVTLLLVLFAVLLNYKAKKAEILSYFLIAISATLLESLANSSGAWNYTRPHILNFPLWLPLYWGMGGIVMKDIYQLVELFLARQK